MVGNVLAETFDPKPEESAPQLHPIVPRARDLPDILRSARVDLDDPETVLFQSPPQPDPPDRQAAHRTERDGEKGNFIFAELEVAGTVMGAVPVFDRPPARRQVERGVNGYEVGLPPPDKGQDLLVFEKQRSGCGRSSEQADARRPARNSGQVDSGDDEFTHTRLAWGLKDSYLSPGLHEVKRKSNGRRGLV